MLSTEKTQPILGLQSQCGSEVDLAHVFTYVERLLECNGIEEGKQVG